MFRLLPCPICGTYLRKGGWRRFIELTGKVKCSKCSAEVLITEDKSGGGFTFVMMSIPVYLVLKGLLGIDGLVAILLLGVPGVFVGFLYFDSYVYKSLLLSRPDSPSSSADVVHTGDG